MMSLGHNTLAPADRIFMRVGRSWAGAFQVYFRLTRFVGSGRPDEYTEALSRLQAARDEALTTLTTSLTTTLPTGTEVALQDEEHDHCPVFAEGSNVYIRQCRRFTLKAEGKGLTLFNNLNRQGIADLLAEDFSQEVQVEVNFHDGGGPTWFTKAKQCRWAA